MTGASLLLGVCLLGQQVTSHDAAKLVDQLGSPRFADREAATSALEKLGTPAIAALRTGTESRDLEIRTRAAAILRKAEGALLTQATLVWLNFDGTPLPDVVRTLRQRSGMSIALVPERLPRWSLERVTLSEPEPLPFWQVVDRLCATAGLHADLEAHGLSNRGGTTLGLASRANQPLYPTSDHGPFRISLIELEFRHRVGYATVPTRRPPARAEQPRPPALAARPRATTSVQCLARLQVMAEPRLGLSQNGPLQLLEANDDHGNSLLPPAAMPVSLTPAAGYLGSSCRSSLNLQAPLRRPDNPGTTISVLRGTVPLRVVARRPNPLIVPLASAAGRTFEHGDLHVAVHEVRSEPNTRHRQIELTVRVDRPDAQPGGDAVSSVDAGARVDALEHHLEVIDDRGEPLPWVQTTVDVEASRVTLTIAGPAGGEPREVRCYGLAETTVTVPFTFRDIPMP
jgi:hypothetical protein